MMITKKKENGRSTHQGKEPERCPTVVKFVFRIKSIDPYKVL
jgi:hypothetical protein